MCFYICMYVYVDQKKKIKRIKTDKKQKKKTEKNSGKCKILKKDRFVMKTTMKNRQRNDRLFRKYVF